MMRQTVSIILFLFSISAIEVSASAVDFERQSITIALTQEPPNLNGTQSTDLVSFFILGHVNEGLVRYDKKGRLSPGVAKSWVVTSDRIVFSLRKDARWSDGSNVNASDFVYAWRLMNDPSTAAPYASIMYPIKNAEKVQAGELPVTSLGVVAVDELTLQVDLENPCGYCIAVMVHGAFYPIKQPFYEAQGTRYAAEVENLLYNGPFKLTSWVHGSKLSMQKNTMYWNKDAITLKEINVGYITADNRTRLNLFRNDSIALARLGAETVLDATIQKLRLRSFVTGGISYVRFNAKENQVTANKKVRQAIQLVFDSDEFVNKIIAIPGYKSTNTFFPSWLNGVNDKFVNEYPVEKKPVDINRARQLINEAKAELNVTQLPPLTLLTVASPTGVKIAEYFQGRLGQTLGLEIKVDQQTFKQYLDKSRRTDFDLCIASWYPDFDDIVTYADLLASYNVNNRGRYNNPVYDQWLKKLQGSADTVERMKAANKLQRIIVEDVPVLPMAETGSAYVQHHKLRGVIRRVLGADPDYTFARVIK
jgi:oligopeptide transport system substrate-binding protein